MSTTQGLIYVLVNPSLEGLIKVGYTTRTIEERVKELSSSTSIPTSFIPIYWKRVSDVKHLEKLIHAQLTSSGFSHGKEYFKVAPPLAIDLIISIIEAKHYDYSEHIEINEHSLEETFLNYFHGRNGLLRNENKAIEILQSAITLGSKSALWKLACLNLNNRPTKNDRAVAYDRLCLSSEANQTAAFFCIAFVYCSIPKDGDIYFKAITQYFKSSNSAVLDEIISAIEDNLIVLGDLKPLVGNEAFVLNSPKNRNELIIYSILHFAQTHQLFGQELCFTEDLDSIRNSISHLKPVLIRELNESKYKAFWTELTWVEENLNWVV